MKEEKTLVLYDEDLALILLGTFVAGAAVAAVYPRQTRFALGAVLQALAAKKEKAPDDAHG